MYLLMFGFERSELLNVNQEKCADAQFFLKMLSLFKRNWVTDAEN